MIDLSIIVVTYNSATNIRECLDSIERAKGRLSIEVTVVDNASVDGTVDLVRQGYPRVKLIANINDGFSCANNQAMILRVRPGTSCSSILTPSYMMVH